MSNLAISPSESSNPLSVPSFLHVDTLSRGHRHTWTWHNRTTLTGSQQMVGWKEYSKTKTEQKPKASKNENSATCFAEIAFLIGTMGLRSETLCTSQKLKTHTQCPYRIGLSKWQMEESKEGWIENTIKDKSMPLLINHKTVNVLMFVVWNIQDIFIF